MIVNNSYVIPSRYLSKTEDIVFSSKLVRGCREGNEQSALSRDPWTKMEDRI